MKFTNHNNVDIIFIGGVMKLREVLTAISGFKYIVNEYDVPQTGKTTVKKTEIECSNTNMRCLQFNLHHERLVGKKWHILTKDEFDHLSTRNNVRCVIIRRSGVEISKKIQEAHLAANKLIVTTHFKERIKERFWLSSTIEVNTYLSPRTQLRPRSGL